MMAGKAFCLLDAFWFLEFPFLCMDNMVAEGIWGKADQNPKVPAPSSKCITTVRQLRSSSYFAPLWFQLTLKWRGFYMSLTRPTRVTTIAVRRTAVLLLATHSDLIILSPSLWLHGHEQTLVIKLAYVGGEKDPLQISILTMKWTPNRKSAHFRSSSLGPLDLSSGESRGHDKDLIPSLIGVSAHLMWTASCQGWQMQGQEIKVNLPKIIPWWLVEHE